MQRPGRDQGSKPAHSRMRSVDVSQSGCQATVESVKKVGEKRKRSSSTPIFAQSNPYGPKGKIISGNLPPIEEEGNSKHGTRIPSRMSWVLKKIGSESKPSPVREERGIKRLSIPSVRHSRAQSTDKSTLQDSAPQRGNIGPSKVVHKRRKSNTSLPIITYTATEPGATSDVESDEDRNSQDSAKSRGAVDRVSTSKPEQNETSNSTSSFVSHTQFQKDKDDMQKATKKSLEEDYRANKLAAKHRQSRSARPSMPQPDYTVPQPDDGFGEEDYMDLDTGEIKVDPKPCHTKMSSKDSGVTEGIYTDANKKTPNVSKQYLESLILSRRYAVMQLRKEPKFQNINDQGGAGMYNVNLHATFHKRCGLDKDHPLAVPAPLRKTKSFMMTDRTASCLRAGVYPKTLLESAKRTAVKAQHVSTETQESEESEDSQSSTDKEEKVPHSSLEADHTLETDSTKQLTSEDQELEEVARMLEWDLRMTPDELEEQHLQCAAADELEEIAMLLEKDLVEEPEVEDSSAGASDVISSSET